MPEVQLELHAMLRKLHLSGMADNFGDLALKAAKAHLTYETCLAEVVQCECVLREQRRIARLLRQSGLPLDKTFRTLQLDRDLRRRISRLDARVAGRREAPVDRRADDSAVRVELRAERLDWVPAVLASLDRPFVIERPDELRGLVAALAERLAASARGS